VQDADIDVSGRRRKVPWGVLVEGYADLLVLAPNDMTGNACAVRPEDEFETLGDVERVGNLERRSRYGHVSD
jgi:hypothetical protein